MLLRERVARRALRLEVLVVAPLPGRRRPALDVTDLERWREVVPERVDEDAPPFRVVRDLVRPVDRPRDFPTDRADDETTFPSICPDALEVSLPRSFVLDRPPTRSTKASAPSMMSLSDVTYPPFLGL